MERPGFFKRMFGKQEADSPAPAAVDSAATFTEEVAAALRAAIPEGTVGVVGDLDLEISKAGGGKNALSLANAYARYCAGPGAKDDVIAQFVAASRDIFRSAGTDTMERERLLPVIKDRAWVAEILASAARREGAKVPELVVDDYSRELVIVYVYDTERGMRYIVSGDLPGLGISAVELSALALANLQRDMPPLRIEGGDGIYQVNGDGHYEASLLLLDAVWSEELFKVSGDIVVTIPARGVLLVTGSENAEGLAQLRGIADQVVGEHPYPLTPQFFVRRGERFVEFEGR